MVADREGGGTGRGQQDSRRKKRLFGQRYMAVNDRETAAAAANSPSDAASSLRGALRGRVPCPAL